MLSSVGFPERNRVGVRGTGNKSIGVQDVATVFRNSGFETLSQSSETIAWVSEML